MKFREVRHHKTYFPMLMWDCGPARVYMWEISTPSSEDFGRWRMDLNWGALTSVGIFDTREEAEEKAKEILNDHIRKILEEIEE